MKRKTLFEIDGLSFVSISNGKVDIELDQSDEKYTYDDVSAVIILNGKDSTDEIGNIVDGEISGYFVSIEEIDYQSYLLGKKKFVNVYINEL